MRESRIEKILKVSPELIEPKFKDCRVENQLTKQKKRLDLLVYFGDQQVVVEVKKGCLCPQDIEQTLDYALEWAKDPNFHIAQEVYLVGLPPKKELDTQFFSRQERYKKYKIKFRYLGVEVPMYVQEKDGGGYEPWKPDSKKKAIKVFSGV